MAGVISRLPDMEIQSGNQSPPPVRAFFIGCWDWRLESRQNRQAGKPALHGCGLQVEVAWN